MQRKFVGLLVFIVGLLLMFGDSLLLAGYEKWFCTSDEPLTFLEKEPVVAYDLNFNHDFRGPRGCGEQCAAALVKYGFLYAEATISNPNEIFLASSPGHYKFYLSTPNDPNCATFVRYFAAKKDEPKRPFHYTDVPDGRCIASVTIESRTAIFRSYGQPQKPNNFLLDAFRYRPSIKRSIDEGTGTVVAAIERLNFRDGWYRNWLSVGGLITSQCVVRRYIRWPDLMKLRDL